MSVPSSAGFLEYARRVGAEVDAALDEVTQLGSGCPARLRAAMRHILLAPGKRLRPLLVLMSAEACGCERGRAIPAACAVELVHTYSLVHDDLPAMDNDDLRRGRPSCHVEFDEATAILAGDALLTLAFEVLATRVEPAAVAARCCAVLAEAAGARQLVGGQADDLAAEHGAGNRELLEAIHARKTAAMFRVSTVLGALVAGAGSEQLSALTTYGMKLGLAFQIVDDVLDCRGETAVMGKRTQKDSNRGKLTYPAIDGVNESLQQAAAYISDARQALDIFAPRPAPLDAVAQFVLERNR